MFKQKGYIQLQGIGSALALFAVICIVVGIVVGNLISWAWPFVKLWIHNITG